MTIDSTKFIGYTVLDSKQSLSIASTKFIGYAVFTPPQDVAISSSKFIGYALYSQLPPDPTPRRILVNTM